MTQTSLHPFVPSSLCASVPLCLCPFSLCLCAFAPFLCASPSAAEPCKALEDGKFAWKASEPLLSPDAKTADPQVSVKDPTVVFHDGRWHLFCTVRQASGKVDIGYLNFADWKEADRAPRHILNCPSQYYCAPQVFYFRPHQRWYLVYQIADKSHTPPFGPACSTSTDLSDPKSWTRHQWFYPTWPEGQRWLDFWVICDEAKAHLFYTSLNGRMWHAETKLADFPAGWSKPEVAIQADIFEASHTYKLKGMDQYLTIVEAQGNSRRYYKAYLADRLEGPWRGLADRLDKPFAGMANVEQDQPWTTNISHGELLRTGCDETLEVDPARLRFLFQGASDPEYRGNNYGKIPWRLGILEMAE